MRNKLATLAVLVAYAPLALVPIKAHAVEDIAPPAGITVNRHGVVILSALPTCRWEDGSASRKPCTWNVGPGDHLGLAYWIGKHGNAHFVWNRSPLRGHPHREWVSQWTADRTRLTIKCWTNGDRAVCPNGYRVTFP
jgi:hypothetical protein